MKILISNDDGYRAEGIQTLAAAMREFADITIVAPDRNRSAASNSLTLEHPLRVHAEKNAFNEQHYSINGTPTDCVHVAITGLLEQEPDMVVSGINHGANLGDDVLYSGTVAAAMEGRFLGLPAVAFSIVSFHPEHFSTAARVAKEVIKKLKDKSLKGDTIVNVNIPDLPYDELRGYQITRLGNRHKSEPVIPAEDPKGRRVYWIGPAGAENDEGEGTDFHAVKNGYVSITPLHTDLTKYSLIEEMNTWIK